MCKVIAIANRKGGVAKTTTTINLGAGLVKSGKRVVLVDADPQGHLTMGLGFPKNLKVTLKSMMENIIMGLEFDPKEAILHHEEGVDLIPSNKLLAGMDMSLFTVEDREKVLKEYLELLKDEYDYILIDCMPSDAGLHYGTERTERRRTGSRLCNHGNSSADRRGSGFSNGRSRYDNGGFPLCVSWTAGGRLPWNRCLLYLPVCDQHDRTGGCSDKCKEISQFLTFLFPVFTRRHSRMFPENIAEITLRAETKLTGNVLDMVIAGDQQFFCTFYFLKGDIFTDCHPHFLFKLS